MRFLYRIEFYSLQYETRIGQPGTKEKPAALKACMKALKNFIQKDTIAL